MSFQRNVCRSEVPVLEDAVYLRKCSTAAIKMNNIDFAEDSDSSDEDYIPGNAQAEVVSEVESDGDPEDSLSDQDDVSKTGRRKRRKKTSKGRKKIKCDSQEDSDKNEVTPGKAELTEAEKKKHADDLWASFKQDTGFKSKSNKSETVTNKETKETPIIKNVAESKPREKITVTQIFEFAGEEVKVEKQVDANSAEARLFSKASGSVEPKRGRGRSGLTGIASVLNHLGKKQKISTLEKSKLDWDKFKKEENIEEELVTFNKGKDGYLERQDFLQRADLRRFEIEREIRTIERNKRMNDV